MTTNTVTNTFIAPASGRESFTFSGEVTLDLANGSPLIIWIGDRRIEITSEATMVIADSASTEA